MAAVHAVIVAPIVVQLNTDNVVSDVCGAVAMADEAQCANTPSSAYMSGDVTCYDVI